MKKKSRVGWVYRAASSSIILIRFVKINSDCCHLPFKKPAFWSCGIFLLCTNKYVLTILKAGYVLKTAFKKFFKQQFDHNLEKIHSFEGSIQSTLFLARYWKGDCCACWIYFPRQWNFQQTEQGSWPCCVTSSKVSGASNYLLENCLKTNLTVWKVSSILLNPLKFQLPLHSLVFF